MNINYRLPIVAALLTGCIASANASDNVIDQRNPKYQKAIEHLSNAAQALAMAKAELQQAEASYPLPGVDLARMQSEIVPMEDTLKVILAPERKRLEYQTITPNGIFFTPTRVGE